MDSIRSLYSATLGSNIGVQGYYVQNKYFDSRRSRQQKLSKSKSKSSLNAKTESPKKQTFIDQIQKQYGKLPAPNQYDTISYKEQKPKLVGSATNRCTIFQQMEKEQKKKNYPGADNHKSNLSKAQVCSYIESNMRNGTEKPGVGQYAAIIQTFSHVGGKFHKQGKKKSISEAKIKMPEVGTYNPKPTSFNLFQYLPQINKKKAYFGRQKRFKSSKQKPIPYYNIISEWGMKQKNHPKDILSKVGSSLSHHSVYY